MSTKNYSEENEYEFEPKSNGGYQQRSYTRARTKMLLCVAKIKHRKIFSTYFNQSSTKQHS